MIDPTVAELIALHRLERLPVEGTLFASTWRSATSRGDGSPDGTAIVGLYCHEPLSRSLFHRLPHDEVWHFYGGDALRLVLLHPDGTDAEVLLGPDHRSGHQVQTVVPAGTWQAGELVPGGTWALFGCTMAPGFTSAGFEGGHRHHLLSRYPQRRNDIERLALDDGVSHQMPDGYAT